VSFWQEKVGKNAARDQAISVRLLATGWRVAVVWECDLAAKAQRADTIDTLARWLSSSEATYCSSPVRVPESLSA
jgi:DNA mismatch endonuclease (patch repair protein)